MSSLECSIIKQTIINDKRIMSEKHEYFQTEKTISSNRHNNSNKPHAQYIQLTLKKDTMTQLEETIPVMADHSNQEATSTTIHNYNPINDIEPQDTPKILEIQPIVTHSLAIQQSYQATSEHLEQTSTNSWSENNISKKTPHNVYQASTKKLKTRSRSKNKNRTTKNSTLPVPTTNHLPALISKNSKLEQHSPEINKKMLISVIPGEQVEVAISSNGQLFEYFIEMNHHAKIRGNIYKGVINNIDANLQAAFINYGNTKNGFLQIDEVHPEYYLQPHEPTKLKKYPPIQKVLKAGQEILVQVVKEPTGNKGAFLTTWLSLAGRFLVLTPGQEQIGISRKVEDEEERTRLRELIKGLEPGSGLGAIVRTVSIGTSKTTLQKDLSFLKRVWREIRKKATTEKSPCLIYEEPSLATRAVRDYLADDITEIWVDDPETKQAIQEVTTLLFPRKTKLVHLYQNNNEPLWEHFKLNKQIIQVHSREVIMPSGGRLVFDQTEALMAIDINSGRIAGKTNFESMAYRTNMEAAATIAQQLRLRDIGGQIVIDFIEMKEPAHCRDVEKELQIAMKADRARHDVGKMSSFGLLQVVRQRIGSSAISISQETCPYCQGTGQRRNIEWQAIQTLREIHKKMQQTVTAGKHEYIHTLDQELGLYLLNNKRNRLIALEQEFGIHLDIRISLLQEIENSDL